MYRGCHRLRLIGQLVGDPLDPRPPNFVSSTQARRKTLRSDAAISNCEGADPTNTPNPDRNYSLDTDLTWSYCRADGLGHNGMPVSGGSMVYEPRWLKRLSAGVTVEEVQRFDAAFDLAKTDFNSRRGDGDQPWGEAAQADVDNAARHRANYKLEAAWSALKSTHREVLRSFEVFELVGAARIVRNEADEKLSGWRQASVADLLPDEMLDNAVGDRQATFVDDLRTRLITARELLDTHSDNMYHKYRILRRAVISTSIAIAVFLGVLVGLVALDWVPAALVPENSPLGSWRLLLVVMTLGIIGAFLSSATELTDRNEKLGVPDLRVSYTLMGMRPIAGALGATVVIVLLQSAFGDAVKLESTSILGIAIAAGFTERLVTRTVTSAADALGG